MPKAVWQTEQSRDRNTLKIGPKIFSIPAFRDGIMRMVEKAEGLLNELVHQADLSSNIVWTLNDDIRCATPGYFFAADESNGSWMRFSGYLFEFVLLNGGYLDSSATAISDPSEYNSSHFEMRKVNKWLQNAEELLRILLFLIHTTSGQPARGTELITLQIKNSSNAARNVYVIDQVIAIHPSYNKTDNATHSRKHIFRFLDPRVSSIFAHYVAFIRPIETFVYSFLHFSD